MTTPPTPRQLLAHHYAAKRAARIAFRDGRTSARKVARLERRLRHLIATPATPRTVREGNLVAGALVSARRIDAMVEAMCIDAGTLAAFYRTRAVEAGVLG